MRLLRRNASRNDIWGVKLKVKYSSIALALILCLVVSGGCKKGNSMDPKGDDTFTFRGLITLAGQALANVNVYLSMDTSLHTTTGADGKFSFSGLAAGTYIITPSRLGNAFNPSNYEVTSPSRIDLNFTVSSATTGTEINDIAANFSGKDQSNRNVFLYDYHHQVILMDFAADWCDPCREKAETAEQFYQFYKDRGFIYILIVIEGDPKIWADTYGLTFPVLNDNSNFIYNQYKGTGIPFPHILDRNCTIRYKKAGWLKSEVEEVIRKYL